MYVCVQNVEQVLRQSGHRDGGTLCPKLNYSNVKEKEWPGLSSFLAWV